MDIFFICIFKILFVKLKVKKNCDLYVCIRCYNIRFFLDGYVLL